MPKKRIDITVHSYFKGGYAPQYTNAFAYSRHNNAYAASHEQKNMQATGAPSLDAKKQTRLQAGRYFDSAPEAILTQLIEQATGAEKTKLKKLNPKSYGQKDYKRANYNWGKFSADLQEAGYIVELNDKPTDDAKFMSGNAETVYSGFDYYKNDPSTALGAMASKKEKIKKAVSKSKSFTMPKAKTKKAGATGGVGFKLKRR
ncbi:MAG: hypothetical protein CL881_07230 [Dehalococcoidia bacterium]|nr:hypothetical protein [Dehalococcoidia bacterium]